MGPNRGETRPGGIGGEVMSAAHRHHEQDMLSNTAWQTALALDGELDRLTVRTGPSQLTTESAQLLLATAQFLAALNAAQPDPAFAATLHQSLMNSAATTPPTSSSPLPATLGIQPALPPMYRGQFRPTPRLAAMLLAVVCLVGALLGGENLANRAMDIVEQDPPPRQFNDVPIFRNDPAGAASQPGPAPDGPVSIHWTFRTGAKLTGSPVIADGILYVGAFNQRLYAIDAETGTERWSFDAGGTVHGPAVVDGVVYVVTGANDLIAVDAASGMERWRVDLKAGNVRLPTVVDGTVYLSSGDMASNIPAVANGTVYTGGGPSSSDGRAGGSVLYAIDATTGQERWRFPTGDTQALYAIDTATGQLHWRNTVNTSPWGVPAVSKDVVIIDPGYNGPLIALNATSGQEIWRYNGSTGQGPVVVENVLYSTNFALDLETGRELWRNDSITPVQAAPAIVGHTAYLMTDLGTLYAVDAESGAERWHTVVGHQIAYALSPIITGNMIYIAASDGTVYALGNQPADPSLAALPRDVPYPEDCSTAPVDPTTVVDPPPSDYQLFVWPLGTPADDTIASQVSSAYRELIACQNTGDRRRTYPLFTDYYWQRSASRGAPMPTESLSASVMSNPAANVAAIRSFSEIELLNDGRIGVVAITEDRGGPEPTLVTEYVIFARSGDRWLIDDAVTIRESPEIPPISLPASNSATGAQSGDITGSATPSIGFATASNYPVGSIVLSRLNTVVLRSIPRTIGEHIGRLPGPRSLTVAGVIVDSGDSLWLPVTDVETGVFGYLSVSDVLPPAQHTLLSHLVGKTVTSDAPIYLRAQPETAQTADEPLPAGTPIRVIGDTIRQGLTWLRVEDPRSGAERWVLPDVLSFEHADIGGATPDPATSTIASPEVAVVVEDLVAEPTSTQTPAIPTEPSPQFIAELTFALDATVTVRSDTSTLVLRALPKTNSEPIARLLPVERIMRVSGPLTDSGDNLWLPVTDKDTGVFGYIPLNQVLPSDQSDSTGFQVGSELQTPNPVPIRRFPEATITAEVTIPAGANLEITNTMLSMGHVWVQVEDSDSGTSGWVHPDVLLSLLSTSGTSAAAQAPTAESTAAVAGPDSAMDEFRIGELVSPTQDQVNLREEPGSESLVIFPLRRDTVLEVTGPPIPADGKIWYPVQVIDEAFVEGFIVADFLAVSTTTTIPTVAITQDP